MDLEGKFCACILLLCLLSFGALSSFKSHFDAGMDSLNNKKFDNALKEFSAALSEDQGNIEARFYYAYSLYYTDKMMEARSEFVKVAEEAKDSPWGMSALSYVEAIDLGIFAPQPEKDLTGLLNISYDSDDNVSLSPILVAEGADTRSSSQLLLEYKPTIFSQKLLYLTTNIFGSIYNNNTNYNYYGGSIGASLYSPFLIGSFLSLSYYSGINYLKYDPYYISDYVEGRVTFNLFQENLAWTSIYVGGENDLYRSSSYEGFDCVNSTFGIRQNLNSLMYVQYESRALLTKADDYANRSDEFTVGAVAPFIALSKLSISGKYINKHFINEDSVGGIKRQDASYSFDISILNDISRDLSTSFRYSYVSYSSNLDKYQTALGYGSYLDHVSSLSISYKF